MKRQEYGFTILELLIVMAIVALVSLVAFPAVKQRQAQAQFEATIQAVGGLLMEARMKALATSRDQTVVFEAVEREFQGLGGKAAVLPPGYAASLLTAKGLAFADQPAFRFFADGTSSGGSITLSSNGQASAVEVKWLSGQISIGKAEPK